MILSKAQLIQLLVEEEMFEAGMGTNESRAVLRTAIALSRSQEATDKLTQSMWQMLSAHEAARVVQ